MEIKISPSTWRDVSVERGRVFALDMIDRLESAMRRMPPEASCSMPLPRFANVWKHSRILIVFLTKLDDIEEIRKRDFSEIASSSELDRRISLLVKKNIAEYCRWQKLSVRSAYMLVWVDARHREKWYQPFALVENLVIRWK